MVISEIYSEPSRVSKVWFFPGIINGPKCSTLDVWLGFEYTSGYV